MLDDIIQRAWLHVEAQHFGTFLKRNEKRQKSKETDVVCQNTNNDQDGGGDGTRANNNGDDIQMKQEKKKENLEREEEEEENDESRIKERPGWVDKLQQEVETLFEPAIPIVTLQEDTSTTTNRPKSAATHKSGGTIENKGKKGEWSLVTVLPDHPNPLYRFHLSTISEEQDVSVTCWYTEIRLENHILSYSGSSQGANRVVVEKYVGLSRPHSVPYDYLEARSVRALDALGILVRDEYQHQHDDDDDDDDGKQDKKQQKSEEEEEEEEDKEEEEKARASHEDKPRVQVIRRWEMYRQPVVRIASKQFDVETCLWNMYKHAIASGTTTHRDGHVEVSDRKRESSEVAVVVPGEIVPLGRHTGWNQVDWACTQAISFEPTSLLLFVMRQPWEYTDWMVTRGYTQLAKDGTVLDTLVSGMMSTCRLSSTSGAILSRLVQFPTKMRASRSDSFPTVCCGHKKKKDTSLHRDEKGEEEKGDERPVCELASAVFCERQETREQTRLVYNAVETKGYRYQSTKEYADARFQIQRACKKQTPHEPVEEEEEEEEEGKEEYRLAVKSITNNREWVRKSIVVPSGVVVMDAVLSGAPTPQLVVYVNRLAEKEKKKEAEEGKKDIIRSLLPPLDFTQHDHIAAWVRHDAMCGDPSTYLCSTTTSTVKLLCRDRHVWICRQPHSKYHSVYKPNVLSRVAQIVGDCGQERDRSTVARLLEMWSDHQMDVCAPTYRHVRKWGPKKVEFTEMFEPLYAAYLQKSTKSNNNGCVARWTMPTKVTEEEKEDEQKQNQEKHEMCVARTFTDIDLYQKEEKIAIEWNGQLLLEHVTRITREPIECAQTRISVFTTRDLENEMTSTIQDVCRRKEEEAAVGEDNAKNKKKKVVCEFSALGMHESFGWERGGLEGAVSELTYNYDEKKDDDDEIEDAHNEEQEREKKESDAEDRGKETKKNKRRPPIDWLACAQSVDGDEERRRKKREQQHKRYIEYVEQEKQYYTDVVNTRGFYLVCQFWWHAFVRISLLYRLLLGSACLLILAVMCTTLSVSTLAVCFGVMVPLVVMFQYQPQQRQHLWRGKPLQGFAWFQQEFHKVWQHAHPCVVAVMCMMVVRVPWMFMVDVVYQTSMTTNKKNKKKEQQTKQGSWSLLPFLVGYWIACDWWIHVSTLTSFPSVCVVSFTSTVATMTLFGLYWYGRTSLLLRLHAAAAEGVPTTLDTNDGDDNVAALPQSHLTIKLVLDTLRYVGKTEDVYPLKEWEAGLHTLRTLLDTKKKKGGSTMVQKANVAYSCINETRLSEWRNFYIKNRNAESTEKWKKGKPQSLVLESLNDEITTALRRVGTLTEHSLYEQAFVSTDWDPVKTSVLEVAAIAGLQFDAPASRRAGFLIEDGEYRCRVLEPAYPVVLSRERVVCIEKKRHTGNEEDEENVSTIQGSSSSSSTSSFETVSTTVERTDDSGRPQESMDTGDDGRLVLQTDWRLSTQSTLPNRILKLVQDEKGYACVLTAHVLPPPSFFPAPSSPERNERQRGPFDTAILKEKQNDQEGKEKQGEKKKGKNGDGEEEEDAKEKEGKEEKKIKDAEKEEDDEMKMKKAALAPFKMRHSRFLVNTIQHVRRDREELVLWSEYVDVPCVACFSRADTVLKCPRRLQHARPLYCHDCCMKMFGENILCPLCRGPITGTIQVDPSIQYISDSSSSSSSSSSTVAPSTTYSENKEENNQDDKSVAENYPAAYSLVSILERGEISCYRPNRINTVPDSHLSIHPLSKCGPSLHGVDAFESLYDLYEYADIPEELQHNTSSSSSSSSAVVMDDPATIYKNSPQKRYDDSVAASLLMCPELKAHNPLPISTGRLLHVTQRDEEGFVVANSDARIGLSRKSIVARDIHHYTERVVKPLPPPSDHFTTCVPTVSSSSLHVPVHSSSFASLSTLSTVVSSSLSSTPIVPTLSSHFMATLPANTSVSFSSLSS